MFSGLSFCDVLTGLPQWDQRPLYSSFSKDVGTEGVSLSWDLGSEVAEEGSREKCGGGGTELAITEAFWKVVWKYGVRSSVGISSKGLGRR